MADDEYVEGDSGSEPADTPVNDERPAAIGEVIDSSAPGDAPQLRIAAHRRAARTEASRKAFAEAINKAAKEKPAAEVKPAAEAAPDPEADEPEVKPQAAVPVAAAPAVATPPAPSLDPEVRRIKEQLAADRQALEAERAELEKRKAEPVEAPPDALSYESYIDSQANAYRNWLEAMRGEKFANDDDFKGEVKDFITALSTDVLDVPLPENVKAQFDAAQAKKIVRTHKTIQERKASLAAAKAEKERAEAAERAQAEAVEREWTQAASVLSQQFVPAADAPSATAKAYPWLAAEDEPGKIIVDVIRAAVTKDGTQLSWQEASKRANEYLEAQYKTAYGKRQALLATQPVATPAPVAKPKAPAPPPAAPPQRARNGWSRDAHLESSKAKFREARAAFKGDE